LAGFTSGGGKQEEGHGDRKLAAVPVASDARSENTPTLCARVSLCSAAIAAAEEACERIADLCEDLDAEE